MSEDRVFLSYNPKVEIEQVLSLRLQTLGAVNNISVMLPYRRTKLKLSGVTKDRILLCDYYVVFSTKALSKEVKEEIDFSIKNGKEVRIFYSFGKRKKKFLKDKFISEHCIEDIYMSGYRFFTSGVYFLIQEVGVGLFALATKVK